MPGILDMLSQTWPARLAQDVWGGITAPRDAWQGKLDALSPEGIARAGNLAGFIMGGSMAAPAQRNATGMIRAYHGSPYDFEKFDLSKIGTGEGAQAYGHGLYFAENEGVARSYKDAMRVTDMNWPVEGTNYDLPAWVARSAQTPKGLEEVRNNFIGRVAENKQALAEGDHTASERVYHTQRIVDALNAVEAGAKVSKPGHMYEVNINAKPEQFLDWDKPLVGQSDAVKSAMLDAVKKTKPWLDEIPNAPGKDLYHMPGFVGGANTSGALNEAGIPGIKYLDQGSRVHNPVGYARDLDMAEQLLTEAHRVGDPRLVADAETKIAAAKARLYPDQTSNYVLFRDDIIDILRKYGLVGTSAGLAATSDQLPIPSQPAPIYAQ